MTNKIRIITDSASDIVNPTRKEVTVLPMRISFGEKEYLDGVDLSHMEFYNMLIESDELPKTSLISPDSFERAYEEAVATGEKVIVITISAKLSGTFRAAVIAAQDYEGKVFAWTAESAAPGERILVEYALQADGSGTDCRGNL